MSNGNLLPQLQTAALERLKSGTQWGKPNGFPFRPKAENHWHLRRPTSPNHPSNALNKTRLRSKKKNV